MPGASSISFTALANRPEKRLPEHPDIKAVAFIGESHTGSLIMGQGAPTLKRLHFELGGKNSVIVFADADLDRALDAVLFHDLLAEWRALHFVLARACSAPIYEDFAGPARSSGSRHSRRPAARSRDRDWAPDSSRSRRESAVLSGESAREGAKVVSRRRARDGRRQELRGADALHRAPVRWKLPRRRYLVPH